MPKAERDRISRTAKRGMQIYTKRPEIFSEPLFFRLRTLITKSDSRFPYVLNRTSFRKIRILFRRIGNAKRDCNSIKRSRSSVNV